MKSLNTLLKLRLVSLVFQTIFVIHITLFSPGIIADEFPSSTPARQVNIEITTHLGDRQTFIDGDIISFFISLDQPSYIYAFYHDASNSIFQLIPGPAKTDNFYTAGVYIPFPPEGSNFQFQVQAPYGKEEIWIYASDNKYISFNPINTEQSLKQISLSKTAIESKIKSASDKIYGSSKLTMQTSSRK